MEGVRGFYGKTHLGEPIGITGQGVARSDKTPHCERRLLTVCCSVGAGKELLRVVLRGQGLDTKLLLRKDSGTVDILWTQGLAWAWWCACVQEAISETAVCSTGCGTERA